MTHTRTATTVRLVSACGLDLAPDSHRWFDQPDDDDLFALDGIDDPVLDVGCGPGRIVTHLVSRGVAALGVDVSSAAIVRARQQGAPVLHRSVFDPLPGTGRWGSAVLMDGNIGIGGDPVRLLGRLRQLLRPGGRVVAEIAPPGVENRVVDARIAMDGTTTSWFPWAVVGADGVADVAADARLCVLSVRSSNDRWFATIQRD